MKEYDYPTDAQIEHMARRIGELLWRQHGPKFWRSEKARLQTTRAALVREAFKFGVAAAVVEKCCLNRSRRQGATR